MRKFPTDYLGFANELHPDDSRHDLYERQRETRGWDDTELWSLDVTTIRFIQSRLKAFREISVVEVPLELTDEILDLLSVYRDHPGFDEWDKVERGLLLYVRNLRRFWY